MPLSGGFNLPLPYASFSCWRGCDSTAVGIPKPATWARNLLYSFENHVLDTDRRELKRGSELIALEPQVFDLLVYLVQNRDRVVSKDDLLSAVWGGRIVSESALSTRVNAVRKAVGDTGEWQNLIRTIARKGFRFVGEVRQEQQPRTPIAQAVVETPNAVLALPDRASIAVLPFSNMSGNTEQDYFADGITDDIITALSKWRWFLVIARNSSFTYKGRNVDVKQIGRDLEVRYVLKGSVRRAGNRVRITAQLVDTATGAHIWAERFDRELTDVFAIQDEVTQRVAAAIEPALAKIETRQATRRKPEHMLAWDHYLRGLWHFHRFNDEDSIAALACFERALELDGNLADAHVGIARVLLSQTIYRLRSERESNLRSSSEAARRALVLDGENAYALYALSIVSAHSGDSETAVTLACRAIDLNPNFASGYFALAIASLFAGRPEEAIAAIDTALRLSPNDPQSFAWLAQRASALYLLKRYEESIEAARQSCGMRWFHTACRVLAAGYAQLGLLEQARLAVSELTASPWAEKTIGEVIMPFKRAADRNHYADGLRRAGMPE